MTRRCMSRGLIVGWGLFLSAACVAAPFSEQRKGKPDGSRCDEDEECVSGACGDYSHLCGHSFCDCPGDTCSKGGEPSPDCSAGWTCVYYETIFGDIGEVFDIE